jgi:hypothetical protein
MRPPQLVQALALSGCFLLTIGGNVAAQAGPALRDSTIREYRGAYQRGFEQSWFASCGAPSDDRQWWVTLTDQALAERDSILATIPKVGPTDGLYIRWKARVSTRMPAGMMGRGTRYILVTEVLEIKPTAGGDPCQPERST